MAGRWLVVQRSLTLRREQWRFSRRLPHHCARLLWYWFLPGFIRVTGWAMRRVAGIRVYRRDGRTELHFPTGDVLFHPGTNTASDYDALSMHFYVTYLGQYFSVMRPPSGAVVVDVGANIGCFALAVARVIGPGGRIICCEPVPENVECLHLTLAANGIDNCTIVTTALGTSVGTLSINMGPGCGVHSAVQWEGAPSVEVPLTTLDQLVADQGLARVDFIKIDTEGMEAEILRGAAEMIRRDRPQVVAAAYHKAGDLELLTDLLKELEPTYTVSWDTRPIWAELDLAAQTGEGPASAAR
jgi:FkbM family methyltransferase